MILLLFIKGDLGLINSNYCGGCEFGRVCGRCSAAAAEGGGQAEERQATMIGGVMHSGVRIK